jgi:hypothetical protein
MDISKALRTVRFLADAVNPITGEVFPDDSPLSTSERHTLAIRGC